MLEQGNGGGSARQLIAAAVVIVVLVLAGVWLSGALRRDAGVQDCVMSGRTNCAPIAAPAR